MENSTLVKAAYLVLLIYAGYMTYEAWTARHKLAGTYIEYGYCLQLLAPDVSAVPVEE
jgi:hypothetical protein